MLQLVVDADTMPSRKPTHHLRRSLHVIATGGTLVTLAIRLCSDLVLQFGAALVLQPSDTMGSWEGCLSGRAVFTSVDAWLC